MDIQTAKTIIGESLTDDEVSALLNRAKAIAKNHHFWHSDDEPKEEELDKFYDRYEYEIYDLAKEVKSAAERNGLKQFTELGVTRIWGVTGSESITTSLSAIPTKTYTL